MKGTYGLFQRILRTREEVGEGKNECVKGFQNEGSSGRPE